MNGTDHIPYLPGFRHIIRDISEAGGMLVQLREVVGDYGVERLIEMLNVGLLVYRAGDALFVLNGDIRMIAEMLDRLEDAETDDDDGPDETAEAVLTASA